MNFFWPVRVYYEDTDAEGVVYYANYLRFFERARTEWLRSLDVDLTTMQARDNKVFVVARAEVDYRRPARLNDELNIEVNVRDPRAASLTFEQRAVRAADSEVLCEGRFLVACVSHQAFSPRRVPGWVKEKISCAMS
ncbi:MAG: tol-pal system-associated acyl-CoA thioesterase [Gammaproteobacteria bacterium]